MLIHIWIHDLLRGDDLERKKYNTVYFFCGLYRYNSAKITSFGSFCPSICPSILQLHNATFYPGYI